MPKAIIRNVNKKLTAEEKARHREIREQIELEKPELIARGRAAKAKHARLREAVGELVEDRPDTK